MYLNTGFSLKQYGLVSGRESLIAANDIKGKGFAHFLHWRSMLNMRNCVTAITLNYLKVKLFVLPMIFS